MDVKRLQRNMYELHGRFLAQRMALAGFGAVWAALVWWLLLGGGLQTAGAWFGWIWAPGDLPRRACLATALSIYYVHGICFPEAGNQLERSLHDCSLDLRIYVILAATGGQNANALRVTGYMGIALFAVGSGFVFVNMPGARCSSE